MKPWVAAGLAVASLMGAVSLEARSPAVGARRQIPLCKTTPAERVDTQVRVLPGAPNWPDFAKSRMGPRNSATMAPLTATGRNLPTDVRL